jgi:hypothetical protein
MSRVTSVSRYSFGTHTVGIAISDKTLSVCLVEADFLKVINNWQKPTALAVGVHHHTRKMCYDIKKTEGGNNQLQC